MKTISGFAMMVMTSLCGFAQFQSNQAYVQSPTVSALGGMMESNVSHYTGKANVSIPLYTLESNGISVPISMSYNTGGVKPDQMPGWTGLNWTLNAGGVITRTVKDLPDDFDMPNKTLRLNQGKFFELQAFNVLAGNGISGDNAGFFFNNNVLNIPAWENQARLDEIVTDELDAEDLEPDIFHFNFLGHSGYFFRDEKGIWRVQSQSNLKVELSSTYFLDLPSALKQSSTNLGGFLTTINEGEMSPFGGFIITDEDGTKYTFGTSTEAIEYSVPFNQQTGQPWQATSWFLLKIKAVDGTEVNFTYESDSYTANMYLGMEFHFKQFFDENGDEIICETIGENESFNTNELASDLIFPRFASYSGSLIRPVFLSKITTQSKEVLFNRVSSTQLMYEDEVFTSNMHMYKELKQPNAIAPPLVTQAIATAEGLFSDDAMAWPFLHKAAQSDDIDDMLDELDWKKLSSIEIKSINEPASFGFEFEYNDDPTERLMLESITRTDQQSTFSDPPYEFEYYADYTLPEYFEEKVDHWGYFNDNTLTFLTSPRTQTWHDNLALNMGTYGNKRAPTSSISRARSGALKKVTFPTGGTVQYTYEQHTYQEELSVDRTSLVTLSSPSICGGLRVHKITEDPDPSLLGDEKVRTYYYVKNYSNSSVVSNLTHSGRKMGDFDYHSVKTFNLGLTEVEEVEISRFSSQSMLPLSENTFGVHVSYPEVVERLDGAGYTIFKSVSTNLDFAPISTYDGYDTPAETYTDRAFMNGRPLSTFVYNETDNLLEKKVFTYELVNSSATQEGRSLLLRDRMIFCMPNNSGGVTETINLFSAYSTVLYYHKFRVKTITHVVNDLSNFSNTKSLVTTYTYNNTGQVTKEEIDDIGNGQILSKEHTYGSAFPNHEEGCCSSSMNGAEFIAFMQDKGILNKPIETVEKVDGDVVRGTLFEYEIPPYGYGLKRSSQLEITAPISNFTPVSVSTSTIQGCPYVNSTSTCFTDFVSNSNYSVHEEFGYNTDKRLVEVDDLETEESTMLWDDMQERIIAIGHNASSGHIAFAGMETGMGDWSLNTANSYSNDAFTGLNSRKVEPTEVGPVIAMTGLDQQRRFKFTAWVKTPAGFTSGMGAIRFYTFEEGQSTTLYPLTCSNCQSLVIEYFGGTSSEWTYVEGFLDIDEIKTNENIGSGTSLGIVLKVENNDANHPLYIDDIRIHPADGMMETFSYDKLFGVTSTLNPNNQKTQYEYDQFGRLILTRDHEGNIIERSTYNYQQ